MMPYASVIIAGYYSSKTVSVMLDSLQRQTCLDFETILVNSSPETDTRDLVQARYPWVRFYQHPERLLMHAARNKGVELARGKLYLFTDPDIELHPQWVEKMIKTHKQGAKAMVAEMGCRKRNWWNSGVHLTKFHDLLPGVAGETTHIAPTAAAGYDKQVFQSIGGFVGDRVCGDAILSWEVNQYEDTRIVRGVPALHIHKHSLVKFLCERHRRGQEFMTERIRFERWSGLKRGIYCLLFPALLLLVLARTARHARGAGWLTRYVITLPVQFLGQAAWCWGECLAQMRKQ